MNNEMIVVNNDGNRQTVLGRDLHKFLEVNEKYTDWMKRMTDFGFDENIDYISYSEKSDKPSGGRPEQNHQITLSMAKEISMLQRSEKGKQARKYFIKCEEELKNQIPSYQIEDDDARYLQWKKEKQEKIQLQEKNKEQQLIIEEKDQKLDEAKVVIDTIVDEWVKLKDRTVFNALLRWLGQKAGNTSEDYRTVYNEFYNELSLICGIKITTREKNYKKKHNVNKISKIELIKNKEWEKVIRCLAGWYLLKGGSLSYLHSLIKKDSDVEL